MDKPPASRHERTSGSLSSNSRPIQLGFVGDILLGELLENYGRGVRTKMERCGVDPFQFSRPELLNNDLNFGNLECVLSTSSNRIGIFREILRAPESAVECLVNARIGVVSLANNHALDHGRQALLECVEILEENGIIVVGFENGKLRQQTPVIVKEKGVNLVLWSFNLANLSQQEFSGRSNEILQLIRESRQAGQVVVMMHWGEEYTSVPPQSIYRLGKAMAAEGVTIICGHHSHRLQGIAMIDNTIFAPSLGNFIFDDRRKASTLTCILQVTLESESASTWRTNPYTINRDFQPAPDNSRKGELLDLNKMLSELIEECDAGRSEIDNQTALRVARGHRMNRIRMRALMLRHFLKYRAGYGELFSHIVGKNRVPFSVSDSSEWS